MSNEAHNHNHLDPEHEDLDQSPPETMGGSIYRAIWGLGLFAVITAGLIAATQLVTRDQIAYQVKQARAKALLAIVPLNSFDNDLVEAFIRMVGIYPPGTLVEMTNGEVGIVVSANANSRLRPKVELVMRADKTLRPPYVINLIDGIPDTSGKPYVIKEGLSNETYGVDVKDYILK